MIASPCKTTGAAPGAVSVSGRKKACIKLAFLCAVALVVLSATLIWLDGRDLGRIKDELSLWTILALVLVVNLLSLLICMLAVAGWRWVRRDWSPDELEDAA